MFKKERDMETIKFRNNLEHFENIKLITKEQHKELLEKDILHMRRSNNEGSIQLAWIGINPPIGSYSLATLYHKTLESLPYTNFTMCVEQNTKNGIRPHIHALAEVNSNCRPNKEILRLSKIYSISNECIEFKISNNNCVNTSRKKYIRGEKVEGKLLYVEKDIKDRELNNLPNFISKGNI